MNGSDDTIIAVENLGKIYRLWRDPLARLTVPLQQRLAGMLARLGWRWGSERLRARAEAAAPEFRALSGITFMLRRGEALGVIGANGSGKSTLLQLVAGVLQPSMGSVQVRGRVAALLELGSGFNPELTGRENIRINAAILGLTPAQIEQRLPAIIAFADIGGYVDQPVKTYSSGMTIRLAFAVQVHIDPDVLIVDEALAVGDAAFQAKAMARVDEILRGGATLLFVGHDLNAVKAFCHRAMLLEGGRIVLDGLPDEVVTEYLNRSRTSKLQQLKALPEDAALAPIDHGYGLDDVRVLRGAINAQRHCSVRYGEMLEIELDVRIRPEMQHPMLIVDVLDLKSLQITGRRIALPVATNGRDVSVRMRMPATLQRGIYSLRTRVADAPSTDRTIVYSRQQGWLSFEVLDDSRGDFIGIFPLPMQIEFER